jgi:membrane protein insertase Oxa1/YidC/SpoIIIJ
MNKQMLYFFPVMIIIIAWNLSAGLVLYLATTTAYSIAEQIYIRKKYS